MLSKKSSEPSNRKEQTLAVYRVDSVLKRETSEAGYLMLPPEIMRKIDAEAGDRVYIRVERASGASDQLSISVSNDRGPTESVGLV